MGRVAEMHRVSYGREWGFGRFFEAKVATELAEQSSGLQWAPSQRAALRAGA